MNKRHNEPFGEMKSLSMPIFPDSNDVGVVYNEPVMSIRGHKLYIYDLPDIIIDFDEMYNRRRDVQSSNTTCDSSRRP